MSRENVSVEKKRKGIGCLRWLGRIALGALILLLVLMAMGAIYQATASAKDEITYKPSGQMVEVDGVHLRLDCRGEGSPTVILEAGASAYSITWTRIQDDVAKFTRVCSYDRAGMGWSDTLPEAQSPEQVAETLHALLNKAGVEPPYIMAGHSLGGIFVRAYAWKYPDEVVGMVLVDSSHENQNQMYPAEFVKFNDTTLTSFKVCQAMAPFGVVRAVKMFDALLVKYSLTEAEKQPVVAAMYRTGFCGAAAREMSAFFVYTRRPHELASLGDMALIVLSAGFSPEENYASMPSSMQSLVPLEVWKQVGEVTEQMQKELVGLSTRGKQITVEESGHNIQVGSA